MQKMTIYQKIGLTIILLAFLAVIGLLGSKELEPYQYQEATITIGE